MAKPSNSIFIGQWIKGDTLSDLLASVLKGDGSGDAYDLAAVTTMKFDLSSIDGTGSKVIVDGTKEPGFTNKIRFHDLTNAWTPPAAPIYEEAFEGWVTLQTAAAFGWCRPSLSLSFRKAP